MFQGNPYTLLFNRQPVLSIILSFLPKLSILFKYPSEKCTTGPPSGANAANIGQFLPRIFLLYLLIT